MIGIPTVIAAMARCIPSATVSRRFHHRSTGGLWQEGRDLLQVYEVRVPGTRPPLAAELEDTSDRRWVTWAELHEACADQFWWPLADAVRRWVTRVYASCA